MSDTRGRYRIGVDVGGTFTDAAVFDDATGLLRYAKAPSTPADPARAVLDVLERLDVDLGEVQRFIHGITIGTNAVLEGRGAEVWMLTTAGFRDVLEIARTNRTVLYDITALKPPPLVPRGRTLEIDERMAFDGSVLRPLDLDQARAAVKSLPSDAAVAVCFLHSYANPDHERAVASLVREDAGGNGPRAGFVTASSEVLPEFREYERFNTTALNAYIGPLIDGYLARLQASVAARGYRSPVFIMTSNGGVATAERARRLPVTTVLSGPAGGVAAAADLGRRLDRPNLITCDMGGTSTDVCLIEDLVVPLTNEQFVGPYANRTPQTEINAVGAGGGSIAWMDSGDILMVGPRSAGADPGPACYGQGGREPTVTDANVVLHRLKPGVRLAGRIALDEDLARRAVRTLDLETLADEAAAEGVVRIAIARMVSAIKQISVAKGHDPRDFTLVAYGGAGPMHGAFIAEELEIERVLVPTGPGNFAALGSLISDVKQDFVRTRTLLPRRLASFAEIADEFDRLEAEAGRSLEAEGVAPEDFSSRRALGMRYLGQSWEIDVNVPPEMATVEALEAAFHDTHERRFGHRNDGETEVVSFRLTGVGRGGKLAFGAWRVAGDLAGARVETRAVFFGGRYFDTPVLARGRLPAGASHAGPAIVEEEGATTVVPPRWRFRVLDSGDLLMESGDA
ncbi:MAG: hydantoinase/oxoprolinase family protein [Thiotrichales bacterium]|nr:hydantoinase/oxoprolinase family protein [Thiotrichales bacterium]